MRVRHDPGKTNGTAKHFQHHHTGPARRLDGGGGGGKSINFQTGESDLPTGRRYTSRVSSYMRSIQKTVFQ